MPRSIVSKLSSRGGIYKFFGDFGLRENIYYGSIFVCMTLIVIVCFLVINNRNGWGSSGLAGSTTAAFYDFGEWLTSNIILCKDSRLEVVVAQVLEQWHSVWAVRV